MSAKLDIHNDINLNGTDIIDCSNIKAEATSISIVTRTSSGVEGTYFDFNDDDNTYGPNVSFGDLILGETKTYFPNNVEIENFLTVHASINLDSNDLNNTGTIYFYGGNVQIDTDACIYNRENTEIEIRTSEINNGQEVGYSCLSLSSDGDGFALMSLNDTGHKSITITSNPEDFTNSIRYEFKEDSIYRGVNGGTPVDLIPHLYRHTILIAANEGYASLTLYTNSATAFTQATLEQYIWELPNHRVAASGWCTEGSITIDGTEFKSSVIVALVSDTPNYPDDLMFAYVDMDSTFTKNLTYGTTTLPTSTTTITDDVSQIF